MSQTTEGEMKGPAAALVLCGVALLAGCASYPGGTGDALRTTPCALAQRPEAYADRRVVVEGILFTDWRDASGLVSEKCPTALLPFAPAKAKPAGYDLAWAEMFRLRNARDKVVTVRVTGVMRDTGRPEGTGVEAESYQVLSVEDEPGGLGVFRKAW